MDLSARLVADLSLAHHESGEAVSLRGQVLDVGWHVLTR